MTQSSFTHRYSEILYAHILDAQGSRLTYTHCTSKVRFDSLLDISFDRPVFIHANKVYKLGVVFNKPGLYPMYQCYQDVMCKLLLGVMIERVTSMFCFQVRVFISSLPFMATMAIIARQLFAMDLFDLLYFYALMLAQGRIIHRTQIT